MQQVNMRSNVLDSTWHGGLHREEQSWHDGPHRERHEKTSSRWRPPCHVALLLTLLATSTTLATEPTNRDVEYARIGERALKLDLYQPAEAASAPAPTIIWVHGGAWRAGSKNQVPVLHWLEHGFAIASVEYRLSPEAKFPAQIHDIKAAIRYLRGNAKRLNLDPNLFVLAGASAGGHLAALAGVSGGVKELEGTLGEHSSESSAVQGIVSFYGASNLQSILSQSTEHGLSVRVPALQLLLGGQPNEVRKLAKLASPVAHVDASDPPLWLIHGDADPQMPPEQSDELRAAYEKVGLPVTLDVVRGGKHGGEEFYSRERLGELATGLTQRGTAVSAVKETSHGGDHRATMRMLFAGSSSTYWNDMPNEIAKVISGKGGLVRQIPVTAELVGRSGSDIGVYLNPDCDYQYGVKPGQSFLDKVSDGDAAYLENVAWTTWLETQEPLR